MVIAAKDAGYSVVVNVITCLLYVWMNLTMGKISLIIM